MLLITPRLVRTLARPEAGFLEFAAGTDATSGAARARAARPDVHPPRRYPARPGDADAPAAAGRGLTMPARSRPVGDPPGQPTAPVPGGIQPPPTAPPTQQ